MAPAELQAATIRNLWYLKVAQPAEGIAAVIARFRAAIAANELVGQFTAAELTAMQAVEEAVAELVSLPGVAAAATRYVPTHRGQALHIQGVND